MAWQAIARGHVSHPRASDGVPSCSLRSTCRNNNDEIIQVVPGKYRKLVITILLWRASGNLHPKCTNANREPQNELASEVAARASPATALLPG
mmetsp:Transcript_43141/g.99956  ORF Transcript_43141/g.99956 Transcript_43141/m.99956 type:complete len:93 (-) Transcript_43141:51-329(-)